MEISYKFNIYGKSAMIWGVVLMLINTGAAISAFRLIAYKLSLQKNGFLAAAGIMLGATLISMLFSGQFLPCQPVTEAELNTQPAIVAFGKNALVYFFPLGITFLLLPFYIVCAKSLLKAGVLQKTPTDMVFIEPRWLLIICLGAIVVSYISTNYLLDKLNTASDYHILFVALIILRFVVYFGLGLSSLAWYHTQVKENC